ncbi:radical SAM protein [Wukongibacter baidiensis]
MNRRKSWSILVKGTNNCNMDCKYCYDKPLRDKIGGLKMSDEMVGHIAKLSSDYAEKVQWIWHGGEPTLMGVEWYKNIQEVFYKNYRTRFVQSMQSNGSLLNEEWARLQRDFGIVIGMSYDVFGQQSIRDDSNDNKSFEEKFKMFKKYDQNIGTISVLNKNNFKRQIELYEYYKQNNYCSPAFNVIYRSGGTLENKLEISAQEFLEEFSKYFKYWLYDSSEKSKQERSVTEAFHHVIGNRELCCTNGDCRNSWLGINADGGVYPCDRHFPDKYYLGNIMDFDSIEDVYNTKGFKDYYEGVQKRFDTHCTECGFWQYCQGGCNANHIAVSGDASGIDEFSCELFKLKFNEVYNILRDVDIYKEKLNLYVLKLAVEHPFFTINEIKNFLWKKGYTAELEYCREDKKLLDCQEFKIFRLFNVFKGATLERPMHSDFIDYKLNISVNLKKINKNVLKIKRNELMEKIYKDNRDRINEILMGVN